MSVCGQCQAAIPAEAERCPACGRAALEPTDELLGRELLGRYRIVRLIAEGGMGRVYVAEQAVGTAMRQVAVKVLRRQLGVDAQVAARFAREAETLVRLTHPNTVQIFDFGALPDGTLALVMEYVRGHSLTAELARGPLPVTRVQRILTQICGALKEAHGHGIVHRDLKPDNVLIADREGHADFVKVLDFGIARVSELDEPQRTKLTQQGMMIGTPPYMSPEQFMGECVDCRSDIYSLGLIAYELLSGRLPFEANTPWEWASKHMTAAPAPLPNLDDAALPRGQAHAIQHALAKKASDRPASVDEFLEEFLAARKSETTQARSMPAAAASTSQGKSESASTRRPTSEGAAPDEPSASLASLRPPRRRAALIGALCALLGVAGTALLTARTLSSAKRDASARELRSEAPPPPPSPPQLAPAAIPEGVMMPEPSPAAASGRARPEERAGHGRPRSQARIEDSRSLEPLREPASVSVSVSAGAHTAGPPGRSEYGRAAAPSVASSPPSGSTAASSQLATPGSPPRAAASSSTSSGTKPAIPRDLSERVTAIRSALARPEVAVGMYQAASARYEAHPALRELRAELATRAAKRVQELISLGRCAQAQALHRALTSIGAASSTAKLFGSRCAPP